MILALIRIFKYEFKIYEKGITQKYPYFLNLFRKKKKEGKFIPYENMIGYIGIKNGDKKIIGGSIIFLRKEKVNWTSSYSYPTEIILELKKHLENAGIKEIPKQCPNCNKEIYTSDIFDGKCIKCGYVLWDKDKYKSG